MGKFNEYTQKATPEDADSLMIYDAAAKANKLSPFSGIWNWIVGKLTNAVISNLQTNNKTMIGALNELNSNSYAIAVHNQSDAGNRVLIELIISEIINKRDNVFNVFGSWKNHQGGYSAIVQKVRYDSNENRISGIVFRADGGGLIFIARIIGEQQDIKIFNFAMSEIK